MKRKHQARYAREFAGSIQAAAVLYKVIRPILWLILALGAPVAFALNSVAQFAPSPAQAVLGTGYSPASMNVSNLPQSQVVHYDKNFIGNLKANAPWLRCANARELPEMAGNQHRLYMYQTLSANTAQAADGVVGSGITVQVVNNTATIGQLADYVNFSDISLMTAIDPALENTQKELAYRLSLSLNTLTKNVADGAAAVDASVSAGSLAYNVAFTKSVITSGVQSLAGRNVQAFSNGTFWGVIHPFIVGDALNDSANNSLTDVLKRTVEGQEKLSELPSPDGDAVPVLEWAGVRFHQSTLVTTTSNYQAQSGKTALRTYIGGENAIIRISLGKKEQAMMGDGDWRNMKLWMYRSSEPSVADPARVIGGWTAYNVKFVATLPPDTVMRLRYIDAVSNIS